MKTTKSSQLIFVKQRQIVPIWGEIIKHIFWSESKAEIDKFLHQHFDQIPHDRINNFDLKLSDVKIGDFYIAIGYGYPIQIIRPKKHCHTF
jgi:hypothetical protein